MHTLNGFIVPLEIFRLLPKLNKDEIIALLQILAGNTNKYKNSPEMQSLTEWGIIKDGKIAWVDDPKATITLYRQPKANTNTMDYEEAKSMVPSLQYDENTKELLYLYIEELRKKGVHFMGTHMREWFNVIHELMEQPGWSQAVQIAMQRGSGNPEFLRTVTARMNKPTKKQDNTAEGW